MIDSKDIECKVFEQVTVALYNDAKCIDINGFVSRKATHANMELFAKILKSNTSLEVLHINYNVMGGEGLNIWASALKSNSSLKRLSLGYAPIRLEATKALADAIAGNKSITRLSMRDNSIGSEGAKFLAHAIKNNDSINELSINNNYIQVRGAKALAAAIVFNKSIDSVYIEDETIGAEGARNLDRAIFLNPKILYALYNGRSEAVEKELIRRQRYIKDLIGKWNKSDVNSFTLQELAEFYNNIDAIRCVTENITCYHTVDLPKFYDTLHALILAKSGIGPALKQEMTIKDMKPILSMWAQLPYTIKSEVSNIPELPKVLMQDEIVQGVIR